MRLADLFRMLATALGLITVGVMSTLVMLIWIALLLVWRVLNLPASFLKQFEKT